LHYDNRRAKIEPKGFSGFDLSDILLDSKPLPTISASSKNRFISKIAYKLHFLKITPLRSSSKSVCKSYLEVGVRKFIKGYFSEEPFFLKGTEFKRYNDLISFIKGFDLAKDVKISKQSVSQLKRRKLILRPVHHTRENLAFANYVESNLSYLDKASFLKN